MSHTVRCPGCGQVRLDCGMPNNHKQLFQAEGGCNAGHPPLKLRLRCGGGRFEIIGEEAEQSDSKID